MFLHVQLKKAKEEEERSKEQRRASLAATRRPSISAVSGAPSMGGEPCTPSSTEQGMALMAESSCKTALQIFWPHLDAALEERAFLGRLSSLLVADASKNASECSCS